MMLLFLHGDEMDLIYFWSSILIVLLPVTVFGVLTYFVVKGYRNRERERGARPLQ